MDRFAVAGFNSDLGSMRGVAGVRDLGAVLLAPGPHDSSVRFDLEEARGLAGQRTLNQWCEELRGSVETGDSFATALGRAGLQRRQVFGLIGALRGILDFRTCRPGEQFTILRSPRGLVEKFIYHKNPLVSYHVDRANNQLTGSRVEEEAQVEIAAISLSIEGSLYSSVERIGESPALVMDIVDIYAWDIDFYIDTHPGDTLRILVEKIGANQKFVRYGRILAAEYAGDIGVHRAFRYQTSSGKVDYYDEQGGSLRKAFLKSPLKFARISSGFGMRVHPVLGFSKRHFGIDLAAPRGTPIWAPADGTVTFAGRQGISGNLVKIRHAKGYETIFAHLNRIAEGIRRGSRVKQKQVIGTVGSTGRSTGPHLHYGMKLDSRHVDPFKQKFPSAAPVPANQLNDYKKYMSELLDRLEAIPPPNESQTASAMLRHKGEG